MTDLRERLRSRTRALVMGVCNRTPDSFSDGGAHLDEAAAARAIEAMVREGADLVDVGAESTRPGSRAVGDAEQIERLGDAIERAVALGALVSVDTSSVVVAERAIAAGARVVNTVRLEPARELGALCAATKTALVLMHSRGSMTEMPGYSAFPDDAYGDVVLDVARELLEAARAAEAAGLDRRDIAIDPGLGFQKNARHSLALCERLPELAALGYPLVVGASRKSFLVAHLPEPRPAPRERLAESVAMAARLARAGAAIVRVHDVAVTLAALRGDAASRRAS